MSLYNYKLALAQPLHCQKPASTELTDSNCMSTGSALSMEQLDLDETLIIYQNMVKKCRNVETGAISKH